MKRTAVLIIAAIVCYSGTGEHISNRDVLYTKDGEEFRGELKEITAEIIEFLTADSSLIFTREDVVSIEFGKQRPGDWWRTVDDIDDELLLKVIGYMPDPEDYAGENYIILFDAHEITVGLDGSIEHIHREISQVYTEGGKDRVALHELYYFPDIERTEIIHARSISPDGRVLHLDDTAIERGPINAYNPDYDRRTILKYALGEVATGGVTDIAERIVRTKTEPLEPYAEFFYFRDEAPVLHRELIVRVEAGAPFNFEEVNWPANWPRFKIRDEGPFTVFTWTVEDIPPIISEALMPPRAKFTPMIAISVGPDWDSIATEFLVSLKEADDYPAIADEIVKRIIKGKKKPAEKAAAIYNWVVEKIRYVDVPASEYSFKPRKLSAILKNQYANDLDRTFLFYALAHRAGIDANFVFASDHREYFDRKTPSLFSATNPVIKINLDTDTVWAELSSEYRPLGVLPEMIMGEEAVVFSESKANITRLPLPAPDREQIEETISAEIDKNGDLKGTLRARYFGNRQREIRGFKQVSDEEIRRAMEERASEIHPNAVLEECELNNIEKLEKIPELNIEFRVKNYALTTDKLLVFQLPGLDYSTWGIGKSSREWPVWFDSPFRGVHKIEIELPKGYRVYHIPNDTLVSADSVSYSANFEVEKRELIFSDDYSRERLSFPPEMYPVFQDSRRVQAAISSSWIVLQKE